ncbi:MAG: HAD-IIA family hydrolase [Anaerolineales bacterium]|jgi:4-nitrophenyl phosphatase
MDAVHEMRGLILDMDGVLWRGNQSLPGVAELVMALRSNSIPLLLVTNNASASPEGVQSRLRTMGAEIETKEVLGSSEATIAWLCERLPPPAPVYAIGEQMLRDTLVQAGYTLHQQSDGVSAVVVGIDRQVDWSKMTEASLAIRAGAIFVGTNADPSFPMERGLAPGNGAILAAIQSATGIDPVVIGKPEPHLFKLALKRLGTDPSYTLMLGDRLETDILGGQRAGLVTALVLTGVTKRDELQQASIQPDWIFEDLPDFLDALLTNTP